MKIQAKKLLKHCVTKHSNFESALDFKVELENFQLQIIAEIKNLISNEISSFEECFFKSSANQSSDTELHQQQILFLEKELTKIT